MKNQMAVELFSEYKVKLNLAIDIYARTSGAAIGGPLAKSAERYGLLAEAWALIATRLSGNKVNYLEQWRNRK